MIYRYLGLVLSIFGLFILSGCFGGSGSSSGSRISGGNAFGGSSSYHMIKSKQDFNDNDGAMKECSKSCSDRSLKFTGIWECKDDSSWGGISKSRQCECQCIRPGTPKKEDSSTKN